MIYGLYQSAAGMLTNEYRQAVVANNLANTDTVGFKRDMVSFAERAAAWEAGERNGTRDRLLDPLTGGVWLGRTQVDHAESPRVATGNWSDVALEGPGFFVVRVDGQPQYTRDGRFHMDVDGRLVSVVDGAPVIGRGGQEIQLDPRGETPNIDTQGRIWQGGGARGALEIVDFPDYRLLQKAGAARFFAPPEQAAVSGAVVHAGVVEQSGTEPLRELVDMMSAARAYLINARMVELQDQSLSRLIGATVMA